MSEALIFASINQQHDNRLFMWNYHENYKCRTCSAHVLPMFWACSFQDNSMNNLLSYCGLVDARISASEKDLPVWLRGKMIITFTSSFDRMMLLHICLLLNPTSSINYYSWLLGAFIRVIHNKFEQKDKPETKKPKKNLTYHMNL